MSAVNISTEIELVYQVEVVGIMPLCTENTTMEVLHVRLKLMLRRAVHSFTVQRGVVPISMFFNQIM